MAKPTFTNAQVTDQLTKNWSDSGYDVAWDGAEITYTLSYLPADPGGNEAAGWIPMSAVMKNAAREALELWDDLIAISITETPNNANADISLNYSSSTGGGTYAKTAFSYNGTRADRALSDSDIWFADNWWSHNDDGDFYGGGYGITTYVHEIGHALGLSHPGHYNGSANFANDAEYYQDTRQYTTMSYFNAGQNGENVDHVGANGYSTRYAASPLLHDILALQSVYGADMTTRTGATTYGFNSNAGRSAFDFSTNIDPVVAIWDAGGNDTIDVSGWNTNQTINLTAGAFSSVGYMTKNLAIAYGATIENAIGGGGNDTISGNGAANRLEGGSGTDSLIGGGGADTLIGGKGSDVLKGGGGADRFHFGSGDQGGTVTDFTEADRLTFASTTAASTVFATAKQVGANAVLTLNGTDIVLSGIDKAMLSRSGDAIVLGDAPSTPAATNDSYSYVKANGDSSITLAQETATSGANDRAIFADLSLSDVSVSSQSGDLVFAWANAGAAGSLSVAANGQYIEGFEFADGSTISGVNFQWGAPSLLGTSGDETIRGSAGDDLIYGYGGDDTLDAGGTAGGRQSLFGFQGDDTYIYSKASGRVEIATATTERASWGNDTLRFTDLDLSDVSFSKQGKHLRIDWTDGADSNHLFVGDGGQYIENLEFADGSTISGVNFQWGSPSLLGTSGDETIRGSAGDDLIYGYGGDDTLDAGGTAGGRQSLFGFQGDDTYIYSKASGRVEVATATTERASWGNDTLRFTDLDLSDVSFSQQGNHLRIDWIDGADSNHLFVGDGGQYIENLEFADGSTLSGVNFQWDSPSLLGTSGDETIRGSAGDDLIYGFSGDDTLDAGGTAGGRQALFGFKGDDTYIYSKASGRVDIATSTTERAGWGNDTLRFTDLDRSDVSFSQQGNHLRIDWTDGGDSNHLFVGDSGQYIESYEFADGSTYDVDDFLF